ncbi:hypothetical protein BD779DRAFT_1607216 [Infundibulicybe gibba]|nr:hypothetical protein BD779DRAFT_1607216 [Infundibulicybe gibba]
MSTSTSASLSSSLQLVLEAGLMTLYAPTWVIEDPLRGSGRRCLTLSPDCLPPRAVYSACIAAGVQWFDWIAVLGGREFYLFVDPGCVSVRVGKKGTPGSQLVTIWADEIPSPTKPSTLRADEAAIQASILAQQHARAQSKTLAQQLLEEDAEDDEELFAMLADEVGAPTWMTPILDQFPTPARSISPLSTSSAHSRSSSRSSNSSSGFSMTSVDSNGSMTSMSTAASIKAEPKQSRREKARQARVFVDTTKTEVTPYDGGKTTVLTGGVMLGGAPSAGKPKKVAKSTNSWRSTRA